MPTLRSKVKRATHNCAWAHAAGGWTIRPDAAGLDLDNTDAVNYKQSFFAFRTHLPAAAVVTSATLKLRVYAPSTLAGESIVASSMQSFGLPSDPTAPAAAVLGSSAAVVVPAGVVAGTLLSFSVKTALEAALADVSYTEGGLVIFRAALQGTTAKNGQISSFTDSYDNDAELTVVFTYTDTASPYSQIMDRVWDCLEGHAAFAALVADGNRIKFTSETNRDPDKGSTHDADNPWVRIVSTGAAPHLLRTTNSSSDHVRFDIQMSTADQRAKTRFFRLKWAVYRALANWQESFEGILWRSQLIRIINLVVASVDEGLAVPVGAQGPRGWATVWQCDIEFFVTGSTL